METLTALEEGLFCVDYALKSALTTCGIVSFDRLTTGGATSSQDSCVALDKPKLYLHAAQSTHKQMSAVQEVAESSAAAEPVIGELRPSTLFDGEVPVVHSVSRFGRQTTRIPRPSHLNTASQDASRQQANAPEQSPVMVYSRVSCRLACADTADPTQPHVFLDPHVLQVEPSPTTGMPYPPPLFQTQGTNTEQAHFAASASARPWSARGATPVSKKEVFSLLGALLPSRTSC